MCISLVSVQENYSDLEHMMLLGGKVIPGEWDCSALSAHHFYVVGRKSSEETRPNDLNVLYKLCFSHTDMQSCGL